MLLAMGGCGSQDDQAAKSQKDLQLLAVGLMPDTDSLPFIIAQEKGYFADEGLKVDIQQFKSAMDRDSALQAAISMVPSRICWPWRLRKTAAST